MSIKSIVITVVLGAIAMMTCSQRWTRTGDWRWGVAAQGCAIATTVVALLLLGACNIKDTRARPPDMGPLRGT